VLLAAAEKEYGMLERQDPKESMRTKAMYLPIDLFIE
jgi:hypothetical protein